MWKVTLNQYNSQWTKQVTVILCWRIRLYGPFIRSQIIRLLFTNWTIKINIQGESDNRN